MSGADIWQIALTAGPAGVRGPTPAVVAGWLAWHDGRAFVATDEPWALWWRAALDARAHARPLPALPEGQSVEHAWLKAALFGVFEDDAPLAHPSLAAEYQRCVAASTQATANLRELAKRQDLTGLRARLDLARLTREPTIAAALYRDALPGLLRAKDRPSVRLAFHTLAQDALTRARPVEAIPLLHRALREALHLADLQAELEDRALLDQALLALSREQARLEALEPWLLAADKAQSLELAAWIASQIGHSAGAVANWDRALVAWQDAAARSEALGNRLALAQDLQGLYKAAQQKNRYEVAMDARARFMALDPESLGFRPPK